MIKISRPQLSSPESQAIKKWIVHAQAARLVELINDEIVALQADLSNDVIQSMTYPAHEASGKEKLEQIGKLRIFLEIFAKYTKMDQYVTVRIEPTHE